MIAPTASAPRAPLVRRYELAGRLLAFRYHDAAAAPPAENFLSSFHLRPVRPGGGEGAAVGASGAHATVDVFTGPPPRAAEAAHSFEVPRGVCRVTAEGLQLDIDGSRIHVGPTPADGVSIWLGQTAHARHPVAVVNALSYAVQGALRKAGLFDLHAACVVEPAGGAGLVVAGTSGSGKSSLTIRLASAGWRYLSDDMVALRDEHEAIRAWAFRRTFSVSEQSLAAAGRASLLPLLGSPVHSDPSKRSLDPAEGFPRQFVGSCEPRAVCFASVTGEPLSRLEPISQAESMRRLLRHAPWASYDTGTARAHLAALARLASQCRSFALYAGRDLIEGPDRAAELLRDCF